MTKNTGRRTTENLFSPRLQQLALDLVVVEDALVRGKASLTRGKIETDDLPRRLDLLLKLDDGVLGVEARVHGKRLGDHEQGISKGLHAEAGAALDGRRLVLDEGLVSGKLKCASTRDDTACCY